MGLYLWFFFEGFAWDGAYWLAKRIVHVADNDVASVANCVKELLGILQNEMLIHQVPWAVSSQLKLVVTCDCPAAKRSLCTEWPAQGKPMNLVWELIRTDDPRWKGGL